mgnify:CR=1 FL=1|jgi:hypothetical protein
MNTSKSRSTSSSKLNPSKSGNAAHPGQDAKILLERLKRGGDSNNTFKKSIIVASLIKKHNMDIEDIVDQSGLSQASVYNMRKLDAMPAKIKQFIKEGRIQSTDVLKLARKQRNEKEFIDTVQRFIKDKESSTAHHMDADLVRKEQMFQQNKSTVVDKRLKTQVEKLVSSWAPQLSATKLQLYTKMITQTIIGAA